MKTAKRLLTAALAVLFTFMCALPAMADEEATPEKTYTLTIDNSEANHTYEAYQIFAGTFSTETVKDVTEGYLSDINWGTGVVNESGDGYNAMITALTEAKLYDSGETMVEGVNDATKVAMALSKLENKAQEVDAFNEIVGAHLTSTCAKATESQDKKTQVFEGLTAGYYLVKDVDNSLKDQQNQSYTKYLVKLVDTTTISVKSQSMNLHKFIVEDGKEVKANNAAMGETVSTAAREAEVKRHRKENFKATLRVFFGRGILSKVCFVILVAFILVAVIGPFLLSDPYSQSVLQKLSDPSQEHFLGTDQLGRDLLTRVVWGARISMVTGLLSAFWAALIGTALGLVAGYFQGIVGNIIMRITDALLSIPPLILTMVLSAVCGGSILSISLIIAVSSVPGYVRMIYSQVLSLRESDYVTASGLIGQNSFMILVKHLLPNCFATLIVMFTMSVGANVMIEAGLSYLGVGITAPTPAWGTMISEGYMYLTICPRLALIPGICLMLLIISLSVVGDGLRDALDPKLRGKL